MKLYGIPNCNTVKKARSWLDQHDIAYTFHDFKKQGIDEITLLDWLQQMHWQQLVNRSGLTWRGLSDELKNSVQDTASASALMCEKTSVIKRPVLVDNKQVILLGFDEAAYSKHFLSE